MVARVAITGPALRRAMQDARYWTPGHPERQAYGEWVSAGWRAIFAGPPTSREAGTGSDTVFVAAYTRTRDGRTEHVSAHVRSAPPRALPGPEPRRGARSPSRGFSHGDEPARLMPAQFLWLPRPPLRLYTRPPVAPAPAPTTPRPPTPNTPPMRRKPNQSGKEAATDRPGWSHGFPRHVGETATRYAERLTDWRYGGRQNWDNRRGSRGLESEFSQIRKHGQRAYEDPSFFFLLPPSEEIEA